VAVVQAVTGLPVAAVVPVVAVVQDTMVVAVVPDGREPLQAGLLLQAEHNLPVVLAVLQPVQPEVRMDYPVYWV
jgi:hypothetical protein